MKHIAIASLLLFAMALAVSNCLAQMYTITNLGTRPGGNASYGNGINNKGQVVGFSYLLVGNTNAAHAFLWDGRFHDLGTLGGTSSAASAINDSGVITGDSTLAGDYPRHAFVYDGTMRDLGDSFGGENSQAQGINSAGTIVGCATVLAASRCHAFLYDGQMHDLGLLDNGLESNANAINKAGLIAGYSWLNGFSYTHAFLYDGAMHDLGTLGGTSSAAEGISDRAEVVGSARLSGDALAHAFLWDGTMHDLGTLGGDSIAYGINNAGEVVGSSEQVPHQGETRAFIYDGKVMKDLNNLLPAKSGWTLMIAKAINDVGQITGTGYYAPDHELRAFLLTPRYKATVQPPIDAEGSSVFSARRNVVPVKFRLTQLGVPTCTLPPANIAVTRTAGGTTGPIAESTYSMPADNGSNFRINTCQYIYNLAASSLGIGTYRADISIAGTVVGHTEFTLE